MMTKKIPLALALFAGVSALTTSAFADPPKKDAGNYAYEFPDDKLLGIDGDGTTAILKVRPMGKRDLLHRPRLQFVQEMLKSVENM